MPQTKFYGSQVGGSSVKPHSYTGSPLSLLYHDIFTAFSLITYLPTIITPITPMGSRHFCELYPSVANLWCIFLHVILIALQLPFLMSIPMWFFLPVWMVVFGVMIFMSINACIWWALNGSKMEYTSDPAYASNEGHEHEQWIFLNGVAVGHHWLQSNINRLSLTFHRPILGIHNKTRGILFDVLQCLIQRNFNYATNDIRSCYVIIKAKLYDPSLTKVVFILHSQGGIEGGMIVDWLLQEVPQDLLGKLEVYTFGCAGNHFNNPHLHIASQAAAQTQTQTQTSTTFAIDKTSFTNGTPSKISTATKPVSKTLHHIEHYAHTSDFVSQWGVLHFTKAFKSPNLDPTTPRFMGRVFERQGMGHQFVMHYLDNMFPLKLVGERGNDDGEAGKEGKGTERNEKGKGRGDTGFTGVDETCAHNEEWFMGSKMTLGNPDSQKEEEEREGFLTSFLGARGADDSDAEVVIRSSETAKQLADEMAAGLGIGMGVGEEVKEFRVKDLSRLWLYVNGRSPPSGGSQGVVRMATL